MEAAERDCRIVWGSRAVSWNAGVSQCFRSGCAELAHLASGAREEPGEDTQTSTCTEAQEEEPAGVSTFQTGCTHLLLCGCAYLRGFGVECIRPPPPPACVCVVMCCPCVCVCACVHVCVCVCVCHLLQGRAETPSVGASEPLHGHWTQTLCSHRVRGSRHTAVRADWSMSSPLSRSQGARRVELCGCAWVCVLCVCVMPFIY